MDNRACIKLHEIGDRVTEKVDSMTIYYEQTRLGAVVPCTDRAFLSAS